LKKLIRRLVGDHEGSVSGYSSTDHVVRYVLPNLSLTSVQKSCGLKGLAGVIPYLGTSLGTVFLAREAAQASQGMTFQKLLPLTTGISNLTGLSIQDALANLHTLEHVQITYGAIILSFLGALHWGMEFSKFGGEQGYARLAVGTVPVLFAWPTTFLSHGIALAVQWFGFTGMWFLDQRASTMGWSEWIETIRADVQHHDGMLLIGSTCPLSSASQSLVLSLGRDTTVPERVR